MQPLIVGQHGEAVGAEEVRVPHPEQSQDHWQIDGQLGAAEVLVHLVAPGEHVLEGVHADEQRDRQPDRRPQRIASTDPVPEFEHALGRDAEGSGGPEVGRHGGEVAGDRVLTAQTGDQPGAGAACVGQRFLGGEGLRGDDEQRRFRIEPLERAAEMGAVHVRNEVHA